MPRISRDARLETREKRKKLKIQHEPYWRLIDPRFYIGYRKGKKGGVWVSRLLLDGSYIKKSLGKADDIQDANNLNVFNYSQAQAKAKVWAEDKENEAAGLSGGVYTVKQAIDDYLEWYKVEKKAFVSTETTCNAHIIPKLGDVIVNDLTRVQVRKWRDKLALTPPRIRSQKGKTKIGKWPEDEDELEEAKRRKKSTTNRILTILKAALNHAFEERIDIPSDLAWRKVKPFKNVDLPKIHFFSRKECTRLINASEPDFRTLIKSSLYCGGRYGELVRIKVKDYNSDTGKILLRKVKNSKPRHVPLSGQGKIFFEQLTVGRKGKENIFLRADGEPWGTGHQKRRMLNACTKAKIDAPGGFHSLRHTYASHLAMEGVPIKVIADLLGNNVLICEKHYAHLCPSYLAEKVEAHLPDFGGVEESNVVAI